MTAMMAAIGELQPAQLAARGCRGPAVTPEERAVASYIYVQPYDFAGWDALRERVRALDWTPAQATESLVRLVAALLAVLKRTSPAAFQDCFGRYGLDVKTSGPAATRSASSAAA